MATSKDQTRQRVKDPTLLRRIVDANQAEVDRSIDEWRAMNGLPPIDRSKKARHDGDQ